MGGSAMVWCSGVTGVWCSFLAIAFLLAALITPHWALTREPLVLDDPYPYYSDLYPYNYHYSNIYPTYQHSKQYQARDQHTQQFKARDRDSQYPVHSSSSSFGPSDPHKLRQVRDTRELARPHRSHFWKQLGRRARREASKIRRETHNDPVRANQTKSYVVVEESSDIVYRGVNISEWGNPFSKKNPLSNTRGSYHVPNTGNTINGERTRQYSGKVKGKSEPPSYDVAAARSYPSSSPISKHFWPQTDLSLDNKREELGRSIPLKRPEADLRDIYHQPTNFNTFPHSETVNNKENLSDNRSRQLKSGLGGDSASHGSGHDIFGYYGNSDNLNWNSNNEERHSDWYDSQEMQDYDSQQKTKAHQVSSVIFRLGLWTVCPSVNISLLNLGELPSTYSITESLPVNLLLLL